MLIVDQVSLVKLDRLSLTKYLRQELQQVASILM